MVKIYLRFGFFAPVQLKIGTLYRKFEGFYFLYLQCLAVQKEYKGKVKVIPLQARCVPEGG